MLDAQLLTTVVVDRTITLFQNLGLVVTAFIITFNLQWKMASVMTATLPGLILSNLGQVNIKLYLIHGDVTYLLIIPKLLSRTSIPFHCTNFITAEMCFGIVFKT